MFAHNRTMHAHICALQLPHVFLRPSLKRTAPPLCLLTDVLGKATLRLSRVAAAPEKYSEPAQIELRQEGTWHSSSADSAASFGRQLEVQIFMCSKGQLATAAKGGAVSVLAATWNVGNAMPPPPEVLAKVWLRGTARGAEHHLVEVAAQECS